MKYILFDLFFLPGNKTNKNNNNNETSEHDADIDEYSDALTMNEDGGESTEPDNNDKTLFFGGQNHETPGNYTVNAIGKQHSLTENFEILNVL